jgi:hypothetical protein
MINTQHQHIVCNTPALAGLELVTDFNGQCNPGLSPVDLEKRDFDIVLLKVLLKRWHSHFGRKSKRCQATLVIREGEGAYCGKVVCQCFPAVGIIRSSRFAIDRDMRSQGVRCVRTASRSRRGRFWCGRQPDGRTLADRRSSRDAPCKNGMASRLSRLSLHHCSGLGYAILAG